jgi:hypothetical protein
MHPVLILAGLAAAASATSASAAPAPSLSTAVKQDLQCFVLYTIAAGAETDETKRTGAIAGTWYFLGQIDAVDPGLDLDQAMRAEIVAMQNNPRTKEIGAACDTQFSKRGADLVNLGRDFHKKAQ